MEDQEIIDQAVKVRDGGQVGWAVNLNWAVMRDCGECAERVKRLHKAVDAVPRPTFTWGQLARMYNEMEILGWNYSSFDKSVRVRYNERLEVRGTLVEEEDLSGREEALKAIENNPNLFLMAVDPHEIEAIKAAMKQCYGTDWRPVKDESTKA